MTTPLNRSVNCRVCGVLIPKPRSSNRKYCSDAHAQKGFRLDHPDHEKERYQKDKQGCRARHLIRKYKGFTQADYDKMLAEQNGACKICECRQEKCLDIDHDHKTGRVRGLLCHNCNLMLGNAHDDPETLAKAIKYLARRLNTWQVAAAS